MRVYSGHIYLFLQPFLFKMGVECWPDATLSICTHKNLLIKDLLFTRTQQNTTHQILNFTDRILSLEPSIHYITNSPTPTTKEPENRPAKQKQRSTNRKPIFFTLCASFWILLNLQINLNRKILYHLSRCDYKALYPILPLWDSTSQDWSFISDKNQVLMTNPVADGRQRACQAQIEWKWVPASHHIHLD
jgi:hypothetical protein